MKKFCDKCNIDTEHRFVKNKTNGYHSCKICLENIRIVAWIVNHCKGELSDAEFIDMCKKCVVYNA